MEFTVGDMVGVCHDQPDPLNVRTATAGSHSYMFLQWSSGPNQGNMLSIAYGNGVLPTDGSEHTAPQRTCPLLEVHVCECWLILDILDGTQAPHAMHALLYVMYRVWWLHNYREVKHCVEVPLMGDIFTPIKNGIKEHFIRCTHCLPTVHSHYTSCVRWVHESLYANSMGIFIFIVHNPYICTYIHGVHSGPLCKRFRIPDPQRNVIGQSTEMSPLVSMLFRTSLHPLNILLIF